MPERIDRIEGAVRIIETLVEYGALSYEEFFTAFRLLKGAKGLDYYSKNRAQVGMLTDSQLKEKLIHSIAKSLAEDIEDGNFKEYQAAKKYGISSHTLKSSVNRSHLMWIPSLVKVSAASNIPLEYMLFNWD